MNTPSDFRKDPEVASEVDAITDTHKSVAATMTTTDAASASEAPSTSAVEKRPTKLDLSEQHEGGTISGSESVANEEAESDVEPETVRGCCRFIAKTRS